MNITKNLGMLLLAIYLILVGLMGLTSIAIPGIVMAIEPIGCWRLNPLSKCGRGCPL